MASLDERAPAVPAIRAVGLCKHYRGRPVVDDFALEVAHGEFYGLLGPNGAGKTTALHMLSTLIPPSSGTAWVAGRSVLTDPVSVRSVIGVVFQEPALDPALTVAENLRFAGLLNHMPSALIRARSVELLQLFGLADARDAPVRTLSGGMRRAVDIARGLMHRPQVLFLDEPTIGLDPSSRRAIWRHIAALRACSDVTIILTTHYLEEAEPCDRAGFIAGGHLVREGTPPTLVAELGRYVVDIEANRPRELVQALHARLRDAVIEGTTATFCFDGHAAELIALQAELGDAIVAMRWRRPNLNDVFLHLARTAEHARVARADPSGVPEPLFR